MAALNPDCISGEIAPSRGSIESIGEAPASATAPTKHERYLDALRGIAALGVVWVHSGVYSAQAGRNWDLSFTGQRGVQLFYIVSAFTILMSMSARSEREQHPTRNFFIRRFFRIAPLFYLAILANLVFRGTVPRIDAPHGVSLTDFALGLTFLHGFKPDAINSIAMGGWSIAVEVSFYLLLPLIFTRIRGILASLTLLLATGFGGWILSRVCHHWWHGGVWDQYFNFLWFPMELPVFCMGVLAFHLWQRFIRDRTVPQREAWSLALLFLAAAIFALSLPVADARLYWSSLAFVPLVLGLALKDWPLLVNPFTVFLGKISYSIYLTHFAVVLLVEKWVTSSHPQLLGTRRGLGVTFCTTLAATIPLSWITFRLIETPGINLGRALLRRLSASDDKDGQPLLSGGGVPANRRPLVGAS